MTDADWIEAYDPLDMISALSRGSDERRVWRYVILCLEGIGEHRTADLIAAHLAGEIDDAALIARRTVLHAQSQGLSGGAYSLGRKPVRIPLATQRARAGLAALEASSWAAMERVTQETRHQLQRSQCAWLRCLFPNPTGFATIDPAWLTSTVLSLAQGIAKDDAFDRLPILADALQDAGCENADILDHCRSDGPHVKGCWLIDALTGRK